MNRRAPIIAKRTKGKFLDLVQSCLDNSTVLNVKRMQKCSKRARQYMKLYAAVKSINLHDNNMGLIQNKHSILEDSIKMYRKLQKKHKKHRGVSVCDMKTLEQNVNGHTKMSDSKEHLICTLVKEMVAL